MNNFDFTLQRLNLLNAKAHTFVNKMRFLLSCPITTWHVADFNIISDKIQVTVQAYNITVTKYKSVLNSLLN